MMAVYLLESKRAEDAWQAVTGAKGDEAAEKRYRSQVRGAPAMIQRNGLGQFFAFLASKGFDVDAPKSGVKGANARLYQNLGRWLLVALRVAPGGLTREQVTPGAGPNADPLRWLLRADCTLEQVMLATSEALAWLQWARRFAESQLKEPETNDNEE